MARSPALTAASVLTLGLGIAAPTAIFGIIDAMFSKLPVEPPHDVVVVELVGRESVDDYSAPWFPPRAQSPKDSNRPSAGWKPQSVPKCE